MLIAKERKIYKGVSPNVDFTADLYMRCLEFQESFILRFCHCKNYRLERPQNGGTCNNGQDYKTGIQEPCNGQGIRS